VLTNIDSGDEQPEPLDIYARPHPYTNPQPKDARNPERWATESIAHRLPHGLPDA
jgi:hypothetical protein